MSREAPSPFLCDDNQTPCSQQISSFVPSHSLRCPPLVHTDSSDSSTTCSPILSPELCTVDVNVDIFENDAAAGIDVKRWNPPLCPARVVTSETREEADAAALATLREVLDTLSLDLQSGPASKLCDREFPSGGYQAHTIDPSNLSISRNKGTDNISNLFATRSLESEGVGGWTSPGDSEFPLVDIYGNIHVKGRHVGVATANLPNGSVNKAPATRFFGARKERSCTDGAKSKRHTGAKCETLRRSRTRTDARLGSEVHSTISSSSPFAPLPGHTQDRLAFPGRLPSPPVSDPLIPFDGVSLGLANAGPFLSLTPIAPPCTSLLRPVPPSRSCSRPNLHTLLPPTLARSISQRAAQAEDKRARLKREEDAMIKNMEEPYMHGSWAFKEVGQMSAGSNVKFDAAQEPKENDPGLEGRPTDKGQPVATLEPDMKCQDVTSHSGVSVEPHESKLASPSHLDSLFLSFFDGFDVPSAHMTSDQSGYYQPAPLGSAENTSHMTSQSLPGLFSFALLNELAISNAMTSPMAGSSDQITMLEPDFGCFNGMKDIDPCYNSLPVSPTSPQSFDPAEVYRQLRVIGDGPRGIKRTSDWESGLVDKSHTPSKRLRT